MPKKSTKSLKKAKKLPLTLNSSMTGLEKPFEEVSLGGESSAVPGVDGRVASGLLTSELTARDIKIGAFSLALHDNVLAEDTSIELNQGHRYGLLGRNGCGKSTFLKCLAAREVPIPSHFDILLVHEAPRSELSALKYLIESAKEERTRLDVMIAKILVEDGPESELLQGLYDRQDELDPATFETRASTILIGLGFKANINSNGGTTIHTKIKDMSGGWRMRVALSRALFVAPSILLLDEPTNHLDLEACVWLEEYLATYKKILIVISHSQDFLNGVCTDMMVMQEKKLRYWYGNFDVYVKTRLDQETNQIELYEKQQAKIDKINISRITKSKQEILDKMKADGLLKMPFEEPLFRFKFTDAGNMDPPLISFSDVAFSYSGQKQDYLFRQVNFAIHPTSRIALVGSNGAGKSTLLKLICGEIAPTEGVISTRLNMSIGYFHQHSAEELDLNKSSVDYISGKYQLKYPNNTLEAWRAVVGNYGIPKEYHLEPISKLSEGLKTRLVFCEISLQNPHLLLLDEPTSTADMEMIDSMVEAINAFNGGVVVISHDFRLLQRMAGEIWVIDKGLKVWDGDIRDYKASLKTNYERITERFKFGRVMQEILVQLLGNKYEGVVCNLYSSAEREQCLLEVIGSRRDVKSCVETLESKIILKFTPVVEESPTTMESLLSTFERLSLGDQRNRSLSVASSMAPSDQLHFTDLAVRDRHKSFVQYKTTGISIRDKQSKELIDIEESFDKIVELLRIERGIPSGSLFIYLEGSSGVGKTQLAFSLRRKVLYIPFGSSQDIYSCFGSILTAMLAALRKDRDSLEKGASSSSKDNELFSAGNISHSGLRFYTFALVLEFLRLLKNQTGDYGVFVGTSDTITLSPMSIKDAREKSELYLRECIVFIDEVPRKDAGNFYNLCLLCRNLVRLMWLPCVLSGTESTLMNVVSSAEGSRNELNHPWVILLPQPPKMVLNDGQMHKINSLLNYERQLLTTTRPLFVEWYLMECTDVALTPSTLRELKLKSLQKKPNMYSDDGLHAQLSLVFADSLYPGYTESTPSALSIQNVKAVRELHSKLIRSHFAYLDTPPPTLEGTLVALYHNGGLTIGNTNSRFSARAYFKRVEEDELLYLFCLRDGLMRENAYIPSSYVFNKFRKQTCYLNQNTLKNDAHKLEEECMAAAVLASHRYDTFSGTKFLSWLSFVVAELNFDERWNPQPVQLSSNDWMEELEHLYIPVLAPLNMNWSESSVVNGHIKWCANSDKMDGRISESKSHLVMLECKDCEMLEADILVSVAGIFKGDPSKVCVLFANSARSFQAQTIDQIDRDIDVYMMRSAGILSMLPRSTLPRSGRSTPRANKLLIIIGLEHIYKNRRSILKHYI